jgi:hypothetical protein
LALKANLKVEKENRKAEKKRNSEARKELYQIRQESHSPDDDVDDGDAIQALVKKHGAKDKKRKAPAKKGAPAKKKAKTAPPKKKSAQDYFPTDNEESEQDDEESEQETEDDTSKTETEKKDKSEYELLRQQNIERNNGVLRNLGLLSAVPGRGGEKAPRIKPRGKGETKNGKYQGISRSRPDSEVEEASSPQRRSSPRKKTGVSYGDGSDLSSDVPTVNGLISPLVPPTGGSPPIDDADTDSRTSNIIEEVQETQPSTKQSAKSCPKDHSILKDFRDVSCGTWCGPGQKFGTAICMSCMKGFHNNTEDTTKITPNVKNPLHYCQNFETVCNAVLCHECFTQQLMKQGRSSRTRR